MGKISNLIECPVCPQRFKTMDKLKQHLKKNKDLWWYDRKNL